MLPLAPFQQPPHIHSLLAAVEDVGKHLSLAHRPGHKEHQLCSPITGVSVPAVLAGGITPPQHRWQDLNR